MTTTRHAVYTNLLAEVQSDVSGTIGASRVNIVSEPFLDSSVDHYIQIVPGTSDHKHPNTELNGIRDPFALHYWKRVLLDRHGSSNERFADATEGVLALAETVQTALVQNDLSGVLYITIRYLGGSPPQEKRDQQYGWVHYFDRFVMDFEIA